MTTRKHGNGDGGMWCSFFRKTDCGADVLDAVRRLAASSHPFLPYEKQLFKMSPPTVHSEESHPPNIVEWMEWKSSGFDSRFSLLLRRDGLRGDRDYDNVEGLFEASPAAF